MQQHPDKGGDPEKVNCSTSIPLFVSIISSKPSRTRTKSWETLRNGKLTTKTVARMMMTREWARSAWWIGAAAPRPSRRAKTCLSSCRLPDSHFFCYSFTCWFIVTLLILLFISLVIYWLNWSFIYLFQFLFIYLFIIYSYPLTFFINYLFIY